MTDVGCRIWDDFCAGPSTARHQEAQNRRKRRSVPRAGLNITPFLAITDRWVF